ncbi:MAG: hypothetical protein U9R66_08380 [Thermodesulfobacteriota bacterium]|nr:hypothetical protein [Thermodesulfobacteriota bacterium]
MKIGGDDVQVSISIDVSKVGIMAPTAICRKVGGGRIGKGAGSVVQVEAVTGEEDVQISISINVSKVGIPAPTAICRQVGGGRICKGAGSIVQVEAVLLVVSIGEDDVQVSITINVTKVGIIAIIAICRQVGRSRIGKGVGSIVQVEAVLLLIIGEDDVQVSITINVSKVGIIAFIVIRRQVGGVRIGKGAGSIVQVEAVLLLIIGDDDVQVSISINVSKVGIIAFIVIRRQVGGVRIGKGAGSIVQVEAVLIIIGDDDVQVSISINVTKVGIPAHIPICREVGRGGICKGASAIVQVEAVLLLIIDDDEIQVSISINVTKIGIMALIPINRQVGSCRIGKGPGSIVQVEAVLVSPISDDDVQVSISINVPKVGISAKIAIRREVGRGNICKGAGSIVQVEAVLLPIGDDDVQVSISINVTKVGIMAVIAISRQIGRGRISKGSASIVQVEAVLLLIIDDDDVQVSISINVTEVGIDARIPICRQVGRGRIGKGAAAIVQVEAVLLVEIIGDDNVQVSISINVTKVSICAIISIRRQAISQQLKNTITGRKNLRAESQNEDRRKD